jgi:glycosyltransferase involved in cell wall biosynthesis
MRLAAIATHPIQYQAPLWRAIAARGTTDLKVFFATRHGLEPALDPGFGQSFAWDIPLIEGYDHEFLPSVRIPLFKGPVGDRFPKDLARKLSEGQFDAVLVHGYANAAAWAGMLAARKLNLPVIMRGESHEQGHRNGLRWRAKAIVLPALLRRIDGFLAIGQLNEAYWKSYGVPPNKINMAYYSVDNDFFSKKSNEQAEEAQALRARWAAAAHDTVFLYCAKLIPVKAPEILLRAFALLAEPKAHLVFVGAGQMEDSLKKLQQELCVSNVCWEGFVNQSALPAYYRASDVLVLPSRFEPWGLVVNEAMACGTPCIVSDAVGASVDMVEGQGTGLVFPHDNVQALASALRAGCDPVSRLQWKANLQNVLENANFTNNVHAIEALLARVVQRGAPKSAKAKP